MSNESNKGGDDMLDEEEEDEVEEVEEEVEEVKEEVKEEVDEDEDGDGLAISGVSVEEIFIQKVSLSK